MRQVKYKATQYKKITNGNIATVKNSMPIFKRENIIPVMMHKNHYRSNSPCSC